MTDYYRTPEGAALVRARYKEVLQHWPEPSKQLRIPTRSGETFVVACGDEAAPPLVLLHGSAGNSAMWLANIADWARSFRVFAVDVIGEPGLSAAVRPPMTSESYALWLDDVLDALEVKAASFVGVSLGGWLGLDFAIRRPQRVVSLGLVSPGGLGPQRIPFGVILLSLFGRWGKSKAAAMVLGRAASPDHSPPAVREFVSLVSLTYEHFRVRKTKLPIFSNTQLETLDVPMIAFLGGRDVLLDTETARQRLEAHTTADVRWLPDAPHFIGGQASALMDFLRRETAGAPACP